MTQLPEFKVESGVPMPKFGHGNSKYPLYNMEVGDSFAVPEAFVAKVRGALCHYKKKGKRFSLRKVDGGYRCWRVE